MRFRLKMLFVVISVFTIVFGAAVTSRRHYVNAVHQLMRRDAIMLDHNGPLNGRAHPWGSLQELFCSDVKWLYFNPTTRRIRFSRSHPGPNPSLSDPTPTEMIKLTDSDIRNMARLRSLEYLDIQGTDISDGQLDHFASLKKLKTLTLGSNVTEAGVDRLQRLLPNCVIVY